MLLKRGHFGKYIKNALKVLKCGAGKDGESQLDRLCKEKSIST
jgi:hypothetical protein